VVLAGVCAPTNPHANGRTLLRFWAADYLAEVGLNGKLVGGYEGGETPFELDVRVLNPAHDRIDGIVLKETPKQTRVNFLYAGDAYNHVSNSNYRQLNAMFRGLQWGIKSWWCIETKQP